MATLTLYMTDSLAGAAHQEMSETSPGTEVFCATGPTGWVVGSTKNADPDTANLDAQTERARTQFATGDLPTTIVTTSGAGNCLRSTNKYSGDFANANWVFHCVVRANTSQGSPNAQGCVRFRLARGTDPAGSGATVIDGTTRVGSTVSLTTGSSSDSTLTFNPGAITLTDEYLFILVAWQRTVVGSATGNDSDFRIGDTGTRVVTSNFTPAAMPIPDIVMAPYRYH